MFFVRNGAVYDVSVLGKPRQKRSLFNILDRKG